MIYWYKALRFVAVDFFYQQKKLIELFEDGKRQDFFRLWTQFIPESIRSEDSTAQKLEFYLNIYFAIYPLKYNIEVSLLSMYLNNPRIVPPFHVVQLWEPNKYAAPWKVNSLFHIRCRQSSNWQYGSPPSWIGENNTSIPSRNV